MTDAQRQRLHRQREEAGLIVLKNVVVHEDFIEELRATGRITTEQTEQPEIIARALEQICRDLTAAVTRDNDGF